MSQEKKMGKGAFAGFLCLTVAFAASALLLWAGERGLVGAKGYKGERWPASAFARLAWLGTGAILASLTIQLRSSRAGAGFLVLTSLAGLLAFGTGFGIVGIAWAGERQNYWDAVHFTSLVWFSAVGCVSSFIAARAASKDGSEWGKMLQGPAFVCTALLLLGWLWTWFGPLQELQADVARYFFLALHG